MDCLDYRLLLNTSYRGWQQCQEAYLALAAQVVVGIPVPRDRIAVARMDVDRALSDFMSLSATIESDEQMIAGGDLVGGMR